jgi:GT2 family glycosyltransferase
MDPKSTLETRYSFSICIITFRRPHLLKKCLDCLSSQLEQFDHCQYEVIVSDDCPAQSALKVVQEAGFATWVQGPNRGVAANRNNIANAAHGDWIIYIDDDEIADKAWLSSLYEAIVSDKYDVLEGRVQPTGFPDSILWYAPVILSGGAYCTANLAIRRDIFKSLGGFNENFNVSHEDTEFGSRIQRARLRSIYLDRAVVYHPARKLPLPQVFKRMIDVQLQSFLTKIPQGKKLSYLLFVNLSIFSLKYGFRVSRFEFLARQQGHWQRTVQSCILLVFTVPIGFFKTLLYLL